MTGKVVEIELENFKSYENAVKIHFKDNFTCVVGPNGAGKSNLVDAVSFVLHVVGGRSRNRSLLDLIHRKEAEDFKHVSRTASVAVVYEAGGQRTLFRRTVNQRLEEHLLVNTAEVDKNTYMSALERCHILSNARNFLVFQGDIESAAHRQGKELTSFFEQVSGSIAHKSEYDRLSAEKSSKEEMMRCCNSVKRNAITEKKRMGEQKSEAERFRKLEAQWQRMRVQFYLFRLFCVKLLADAASMAHRQEAEQHRGLQAQADSKEKELHEAEAARERSHQYLAEAQRARIDAQGEAEDLNPKIVRLWSEIEFAQRQHEAMARESTRHDERQAQLEAEVAKLESALSDVQRELDDVALQAQHRVLFTPRQQALFDSAQQRAEQETTETNQQVHELEAQIRVTASDRAHVEADVREARMRYDQLSVRKKAFEEGVRNAIAQQERDEEDCQDRRKAVDELKAWLSSQDNDLRATLKERDKMQKEIQDITITGKQIEREKQLKQISADLQRLVPGVHGRVVELCRTSTRDFDKAVHVALNGYLDAIIVDNPEAGRQCVQYLKDRMLQPMTFVPLSSLNVQSDGRLNETASQQEGMRMALSCITYDPQRHGKVFEFLLGNVVIAENLVKGRQFFFKDLRRLGLSCRMVTMQGETISENGNIAVGSAGMSQGVTRFDFTRLEATKRSLDELAATICKMRSLTAAGHDGEASAREELRTLEAKVLQSAEVLSRCEKDLQGCETNETNSSRILENKEPELNQLREAERALREQRQRLEAEISEAVSQHFAALSAEMGEPDIRQLERKWRQERADAQRRQGDLLQHKGSVEAELRFMQEALQNQADEDLTDKLEKLELKIDTLTAEHQKVQTQNEAMDLQATGRDGRVAATVEEERNCEQAFFKCRQALKEASSLLSELDKKLVEREADLQALHEKRLDLLRQSVYDGVDLPFLSVQGQGLGRDALQELAASSHDRGAERRAAAIAVDLGSLDDEKRRIVDRGQTAQNVEEERYRAELKKLAMELERLRPNLKAIEQLQLASAEVVQAAQETMEAQKELESAELRFEAVRLKRKELFMDCFRNVAAGIDSIYKDLTRHVAVTAMEGSAFLDLEDLEDPFCAGVNFTAMPPAKRVSELGNLSGGEKAMAALALLFAVYTYQRPPFLMLDEVDAHLDANNMLALATFMRSFDCQTIVISLKEQLFTQCQAMVGVTKNRRREASCIFTFDLEPLRIEPGAVPATPPDLSPGVRGVLIPLLDQALPAPATPHSAAAPSPAASSQPPATPSPSPQRSASGSPPVLPAASSPAPFSASPSPHRPATASPLAPAPAADSPPAMVAAFLTAPAAPSPLEPAVASPLAPAPVSPLAPAAASSLASAALSPPVLLHALTSPSSPPPAIASMRLLASSAALARAAAEDAVPKAAQRREDRLREAERERKSAAEVEHEQLEELRGRVMGRLRVLQMGIPMRVNMMTKQQLQTYYESLAPADACQEHGPILDASSPPRASASPSPHQPAPSSPPAVSAALPGDSSAGHADDVHAADGWAMDVDVADIADALAMDQEQEQVEHMDVEP